MLTIELILGLAAIISFLGGIVIWGIRLEGLVKMNKKELDHTNDRIDQINNSLDKRLTVIDTRLEAIGSTLERIIWRLPSNGNDNDRNNGNN